MADQLAKRILVVDDNLTLLEALQFELENAGEGYQVETASSEQDALERLRCRVFHVAVVDVRMRDNRDAQDRSGLTIARHALGLSVPTIVHTAFPDDKLREQAMEDGLSLEEDDDTAEHMKANYFVDKNDARPKRLQDCIRRCIRQSKVNFSLQILVEGSATLDHLAAMLSRHDPDCALADAAALRYVLAALFHDARSILICPLTNGHFSPMPSGALTVIVKPTFGSSGGGAIFVKISRAGEVREEARNHQEFSKYLQGAPRTALERVAYAGQFGALQYALLGMANGGTYQTFSQYYDKIADAQALSSAIIRFFDDSYRHIHTSIKTAQGDLTALYAQTLKLSLPEVTASLQDLVRQDLGQPRLTVGDLTLNNPLFFIRTEDSSGQRVFRPMVRLYRRCMCHGDLHTRNILVSDRQDFWLIDFARVGDSHALRDIAELEADIKFSVVQHITMQDYALLERALYTEDNAPANGNGLPASLRTRELQKVYHVIRAIRAHMLNRIQPVDQREYQIALLYHALKVLTLKRDKDREKKLRALITVSLLTDLLQDNELPPFSAAQSEPNGEGPGLLLIGLLVVVLLGIMALYLVFRDPFWTLAALICAVVVTLVLIGRISPDFLTALVEKIVGQRK